VSGAWRAATACGGRVQGCGAGMRAWVGGGLLPLGTRCPRPAAQPCTLPGRPRCTHAPAASHPPGAQPGGCSGQRSSHCCAWAERAVQWADGRRHQVAAQRVPGAAVTAPSAHCTLASCAVWKMRPAIKPRCHPQGGTRHPRHSAPGRQLGAGSCRATDLQHLLDLRLETHVQHPVGLVQHHVRNTRQRGVALCRREGGGGRRPEAGMVQPAAAGATSCRAAGVGHAGSGCGMTCTQHSQRAGRLRARARCGSPPAPTPPPAAGGR
jgi:hypothetical protein